MGKDNELLAAVKEGNVQNVRKILQKYRKSHKKNVHKKSTINNPDVDGFTVLHHAALFGNVEVVMAIIEMEGDPNCVDQKGMTPLHLSAWAGKDGPVKALLENRALPNLPSHSGDTPLHLAAQHGYAGCTKVLLTFHADGSFRNDNKETPLDLACQYGHTGVVKQLITDDKVKTLLMTPMTDQRYKSPLHLSAKSGHDDIAHLLIQGGANVNDTRVEGTPLHQAALYGKTDVVRLLLRAGADASIKNSHGLMALDLVNRFTTSRAGLEIKQMLREAAGDRVAYARAVSDYNNQFDETSLTFKVGDTIAVIEQNEDGRWKGYVVNSEAEKIGYFPAMVVQLISKSKKTHSLGSRSSQASVESGLSGNGSGSYAPSVNSSPEKHSESPNSPVIQPVGIVPIGSYEVVTLAQANPDTLGNPKQTANGSFPPRMSSFKQKKNAPPQSSPKTPQNSDHLRNKSTPMSQPCHVNNEQTKVYMQRSKSEDRSRVKFDPNHHNNNNNNIDPNVLKRLSPMTSPGHSPTLRSRAGQHEFIQNLRQQQQYQIQQQQLLTQQLQHDFSTLKRPDKEKPTIYADVEVMPGKSHNDKSPPSHMTNYNTAYFDQVDGNKHHFNNSSTPSITDNESVSSSNASCDNKLLTTPTIKPILVKSKSNDSYNKTPSVSDTEGSIKNGYSVKFANSSPEEIRRERMNSYEPMYSDDNSYNTINRPVYHRSNSEGFSDYNQNGMSNNCFTLKRPKKKTDGHHEVPFPIAFPPPPPLSNGSGSISPSHNGSPKSLHQSPQMRESWSSSKTSESNSPKLSGSPLSINRLSDSSYSPRIDSSSSPRTPVFEDDMRFPPSNEQLDEEDQKVLDWLIDLKLASYFYNFQLHGFDMISIRAITPEDLNIMDIKKTGHRKKLLSEIAKLPPATELPKLKPDDVGSWLARLNLEQYEANFIEGGFDDIDFLKDLDKNDLDMIDIKKKGHQKKILMAVQQLSDLELTAILDEVVAETPVRRGLSVNGRNYSDQILQEFFPSNFPNIVIASSAQNTTTNGLYNTTSGGGTAMEQTTVAQRSPPAPAARPSVPPPVAQKNPNIIPPKPKPKPKPVRANGTTNGYHHRGSSSESLNESGTLGNGSLNSSGEIQGDQEEIVTSSKSRNFFKEQERKASVNSQDGFERKPSLTSLSSEGSPSNTIKRNGPKPPPSLKPKPISSIPENCNGVTPHSPKPPPPAPPKRSDSIKNGIDTEQLNMIYNDEAPALPVKSKSRSSESDTPVTPNNAYPSPPAGFATPIEEAAPPPPPQNKVNNLPPHSTTAFHEEYENNLSNKPLEKKKDAIDDAFGSTDDLLNDLMADINDFSAQLDAMF